MLLPRLPSTAIQDSKSEQRFRSGSIFFWPAGCSPSVTLHLPIQKSNCRYSCESQAGVGTEGAGFTSSALAPRFQQTAPAVASDTYRFGGYSIFVSSILPSYGQARDAGPLSLA